MEACPHPTPLTEQDVPVNNEDLLITVKAHAKGVTVVQADHGDANSVLTMARQLVVDFGARVALVMPTQEQQFPQARAAGGGCGKEEDLLSH
jgi:hypothetical protein